MQIRRPRIGRALVALGLLGLAVFAVINAGPVLGFLTSARHLTSLAPWTRIGIAAVLVIAGHLARTQRTKMLLDHARRGPFLEQFRDLSIGYYFNLVLPFRAGELIRTFLLARRLRISLLYTLVSVIIERLLDIVLVSCLFLIVATMTGVVPMLLIATAGVVFFVALVPLFVFVLLLRQNDLLMGIVWRGSRILSPGGERKLRMSIWSVVHGFQQFSKSRANLAQYLVFFLLSWIAYLAAFAILLITVFPGAAGNIALGSLGPFLFPEALFSLPSFTSYTATLTDFLVRVNVLPQATQAAFIAGIGWVVLNVPISVIGFVSLFGTRVAHRMKTTTPAERTTSLDRSVDRGQELSIFLDSFFRHDGLAQALHLMDVDGEIELIRFFKGGSDAVTALIRDESGLRVRKVVPLQYYAKLKQQYDWLQLRRNDTGIVTVLAEQVRDDFYSIDLSFDPSTVPLFTYVHSSSLADSTRILTGAWNTLFDKVYKLSPQRSHEQLRDEYVTARLLSRVELAATHHTDLLSVLACENLRIGGIDQLNFRQVIAAIKAHPTAWQDLSMFQTSTAIHGDFTIDNILVNIPAGQALIIDPSDDNQVQGPVLDFARHFQSLWGGYEFLNDDATAPIVAITADGTTASVDYLSVRSARYEELAQWTWALAEERLSPEELRSLPFHVGLLYGRMLTHRVTMNPATALLYYAKSVEFLNVFYAQYVDTKKEIGV